MGRLLGMVKICKKVFVGTNYETEDKHGNLPGNPARQT
jgi:hypothetical protein